MTGPYFSNEEWTERLKATKELTMSNENVKPEPKDSVISEREMYERDQRLSCLSHSVSLARETGEHDDIINKAKLFYDFIEKGK